MSFRSRHAAYTLRNVTPAIPSGVNHTPGWTETGEESETRPSTNSCSSNSSWSIWEPLNTAATETSKVTFEPFISEHEIQTGCISHTYLVHSWESNTLNSDPLCSLPQQQLIYPRHCTHGSFYAGEFLASRKCSSGEKEKTLIWCWTGLLSAYQTEQDCRYTCTGYCGEISKQIIEGYLSTPRLQMQI